MENLKYQNKQTLGQSITRSKIFRKDQSLISKFIDSKEQIKMKTSQVQINQQQSMKILQFQLSFKKECNFLNDFLFQIHKFIHTFSNHPQQNCNYPIYINIMKLITLTILAFIIFVVNADSCGGNCPSGKCPTCFCGNNKSMQDIAYWCDQYSWDKKCCQCIVSHQSGGNAHAINYNTNGSTDVGLWQINNINWGQCSEGKAPCDPKVNLNCAIDIYKWGGNTFKLWNTHAACGC